MNYLSNAFALSMIDRDDQGEAVWMDDGSPFVPKPIHWGDVVERLQDGTEWKSVVGHADTATILGGILGMDVPPNRVSIKLAPGDSLVVGQYIGPRLPEGAKELPEGAKIEWWLVEESTRD